MPVNWTGPLGEPHVLPNLYWDPEAERLYVHVRTRYHWWDDGGREHIVDRLPDSAHRLAYV